MGTTRSTYCISVSTFDQTQKLDEAALRDHFRRIAEAGVGIYVGGPPAEGWALSNDEIQRSLEIAVDEAGDQVPVRFMGFEPRRLEDMIEQVRVSSGCGVDAIQIYSLDMGHGQHPKPDEIETYFRGVLDATETRCVISSHFWEGYVLDPMLMRRLTDDYAHLIGFNVTNPDIYYVAAVKELLPPNIEVHVGGPMQALGALAMGATGYLSTISNFAPRMCQSVVEHYNAGDYPAAQEAWWQLMRLKMRIYGKGGNPTRVIKAAMDALGRPGTGMRSPHMPAGEAERKAIARAVAEFREQIG
jgi:4-hydroxy-tetrahydrodipicolinate synthase